MKKQSTTIKELFEQLELIVAWFEKQEEIEVEQALIKLSQATKIIALLKSKLTKAENEFKEIKKELLIDEVSDA